MGDVGIKVALNPVPRAGGDGRGGVETRGVGSTARTDAGGGQTFRPEAGGVELAFIVENGDEQAIGNLEVSGSGQEDVIHGGGGERIAASAARGIFGIVLQGGDGGRRGGIGGIAKESAGTERSGAEALGAEIALEVFIVRTGPQHVVEKTAQVFEKDGWGVRAGACGDVGAVGFGMEGVAGADGRDADGGTAGQSGVVLGNVLFVVQTIAGNDGAGGVCAYLFGDKVAKERVGGGDQTVVDAVDEGSFGEDGDAAFGGQVDGLFLIYDAVVAVLPFGGVGVEAKVFTAQAGTTPAARGNGGITFVPVGSTVIGPK